MTVPYIQGSQNTGNLVTTGLLRARSNASSPYKLASGAIKALREFEPTINVDGNIQVQPTTGPSLGGINGTRPVKPRNFTPVYPASPDAPIFPDLTLEDMAIPGEVIQSSFTPYKSDLLTKLKAKLTDQIVNGGTGLSPQVETATFNQDQERALLALDEFKARAAGVSISCQAK